MKKVLIITPHLSTGGQPQYLLKKLKSLGSEYDFYVVEWENITGGVLVVQRNQIVNLLKEKFFSLDGDKNFILDVILGVNPDIIHFEEIPETFISKDILNIIYRKDRKYNIVCTTHSSFTDPKNLKYTADKFILVSNWSKKIFDSHFNNEIPCDVWEYPTEMIEYDKNQSKLELGFDPEYKHVLHVGLFTSGKNQKSIVDLARTLIGHKIKFHFVGNQATNFEDYWRPIMENFPENCIWHGERHDVDKFYKAADLFYFPSNFELNPLALKEAISYGIPIFTKKLHTYENTYDNVATYITDDISYNKKLLLNHFNIEDKKPKIQIIHLLTNVGDDREIKSINDLSKLSSYGIDYKQQINEVIDTIPPKEFCNRPEAVGDKPKHLGNGYGTLTGRHYGCFLAHTNALKNIDDEYDYTLIFESDANVETSIEEFVNVIYSACDISEKDNVYYISFANNNSSQKIKINELFSETSANQDLAHCYLIPNKLKSWYLDRINDCKWDGYDIWLNNIFAKHKEKRYTTNKIYSNQIEGLSLIDNVIKWVNDYTPEILPVLIFSTGRRLDYLSKTLKSIFDNNPDFNKFFKRVWVLDDRSSFVERYEMDKLLNHYFGDNYNTIQFNSNENYYFVEKFKMIKNLITPQDIVFFMEDDWSCHTDINLFYHIFNLKNSDWTQIAFADPFNIQDEELQQSSINDDYWHNPYPKFFKHPVKWDGDTCFWNLGSINNWTNNPSIIKGEVFFKCDFKNIKNFEWDFAMNLNGKQVFTKNALFRHFGTNSLIDKL